jgi:hypothetical protein
MTSFGADSSGFWTLLAFVLVVGCRASAPPSLSVDRSNANGIERKPPVQNPTPDQQSTLRSEQADSLAPRKPQVAQPSETTQRQACRAHSECASGVCDHYKKDNGYCAKPDCSAGERVDNNHYFCSSARKWQKSKAKGEPCRYAYECFEPTCYMNPSCDLTPKSVAQCQKGICTLRVEMDECAKQGRRRVLAPEEWHRSTDGSCFQSMAQRLLRTVCVPCGNGRCDSEESACNCPEDCKR